MKLARQNTITDNRTRFWVTFFPSCPQMTQQFRCPKNLELFLKIKICRITYPYNLPLAKF